MDYLLHIAVLVAIYAVLAVSLDLLAGHTGLLSVAHAAFYGVGAYTAALLSTRTGLPFPLSVVCGMAVASILSLMVSLPSLRLHEDYFVIAAFGFQIILFNTFNNWTDLTGGPLGIVGIPRPAVAGWRVESPLALASLTSAWAAGAYWVVQRIAASPMGRVLRAIREDEVFARSVGKDTVRFKITAFAVSAALAASAGGLYAHYITYIDPTSFTVDESLLVLSMVIIGGAGSPWGPLIGATLLVTLPEALRFLGLPAAAAANLRQIAYGSLLVLMVSYRPTGLAGRYGFGR